MLKQTTFNVLVYKTDKAFHQAGQYYTINCHHLNKGNHGMTTKGKIVALPDATISSPPSEVSKINEATVLPRANQFATNYVAVTEVKDLVTLTTYWVDTASYNTNVPNCNI